MLLMWLGEQITQRGIGNGVSLLITVGILSDIPNAAQQTVAFFTRQVGSSDSSKLPQAVLMIALFFLVVAGIIMVVQGQRKIPVQYAKRVVGNKVMGGQSSFLPLKVNYSGVMPVIFAGAILLFPQQMFRWIGAAFKLEFLVDFSVNLQRGRLGLLRGYTLLILFFSYFWVSVMFKPIQIADELKRGGGYIPGVRPGEPTAQFLDFIMTRLTLAGAIFLTVIAVIPDLLYEGVPRADPGGLLLRRHRHVDHRGRDPRHDEAGRDVPPPAPLRRLPQEGAHPGPQFGHADQAMTGDAVDPKNLGKLVFTVGAIFAVGLLAWLIQYFRNR